MLEQRKAGTSQEERGQSSLQGWAGQCCSGKSVETWIVWVLSYLVRLGKTEV